MNNWHLIAILAAFLAITGFITVDAYRIRGEIVRNRAVLDRLTAEHDASELRMKELVERIDRLKNGHRSVETMALKKYRMLRPDQYIVHDAAD
jgi:hypothetical protein